MLGAALCLVSIGIPCGVPCCWKPGTFALAAVSTPRCLLPSASIAAALASTSAGFVGGGPKVVAVGILASATAPTTLA